MTHFHSIRKMLEIKDKNIKIEDKLSQETIDQVQAQVFRGELTYIPRESVNCGIIIQSHADIVKNGKK